MKNLTTCSLTALALALLPCLASGRSGLPIYIKASNTGSNDDFGAAVAVSGDTLVVGAPGEASGFASPFTDQDDNSQPDAGAVYVFVKSGSTWVQEAYLKASNPDFIDRFGGVVAISGDTLVVGALGEDSPATGVGGSQVNSIFSSRSGAAYVFVRSGGVWTQQAYIKASNAAYGDEFGSAVAISGDTLAIAARGERSGFVGVPGDNSAFGAGAVYVFERQGTTWSESAYLKASNVGADDAFGSALALDADLLAVGTPFEDSASTGTCAGGADDSAAEAGAVYVFERGLGAWPETAYLKASNAEAGDRFGTSVATASGRILVGAPDEDSATSEVDGDEADNSASGAGAGYAFEEAPGCWLQTAYLKGANAVAIGSSVAMSGSTALLESPHSASVGTRVFEASAGLWSVLPSLLSAGSGVVSVPEPSVIGMWNDTVAWGFSNENGSATGVGGDPSVQGSSSSGAVYVFDLAKHSGVQVYGDMAGSNLATLGSSTPPISGLFFWLTAKDLTGSGPGFMMISTSSASQPLLGGKLLVDPGTSLLGPSGLFSFLVPSSFGNLVLQVPPGLAGTSFFAQAFRVDLSQPFGFVFTNGLSILVGV